MMEHLGLPKRLWLQGEESKQGLDESSGSPMLFSVDRGLNKEYNPVNDTNDDLDSDRTEPKMVPDSSHKLMLNNQAPVPPYREAVRCIERIKVCVTPREKLACLSECFSAMKMAVVDFHKGKLELSSMDDVLPLTIYIVC